MSATPPTKFGEGHNFVTTLNEKECFRPMFLFLLSHGILLAQHWLAFCSNQEDGYPFAKETCGQARFRLFLVLRWSKVLVSTAVLR